MRDTTQCFARLGLDSDADARAIRRAYARELKQIDQLRDAAGFQELREAYELALHVAAHQAAIAAESATADVDGAGRAHAPLATEQPSPAPVAAPPDEDPRELANAAFQRLAAVRPGLTDQAGWEDALRGQLNSDELLNMTARFIFEVHIAHVLAEGWQAGHELLFPAAANVFRWLDDCRRLAHCGHAGAVVSEAVDELLMFGRQDKAQRDAQRETLSRVREHPEPTQEALRHYRFHFETMAASFPTMLALMSNPRNRSRWQELYKDMPRAREAFSVDEEVLRRFDVSVKKDKTPWHASRGWGIGIFLAVSALARLLSSEREAPEPQREAFPPLTMKQAPMWRGEPISEERINEIATRIEYRPPGRKQMLLAVEYDVFLDADKSVLGMNKVSSSGDIEYDEAVAKAIRESKRFPDSSVTRFRASFRFYRGPKPEGGPRPPGP